MQVLAFYLFSIVTIGSALMVVTARNPVHSVFFLITAFFSSSGIFVLLGAEFLAMVLVVVYVGAVAVLFLFVVMMLDIPVSSVKSWFFPHFKNLITATTQLLSYLFIFAFFSITAYGIFYCFNKYVFNILTLLYNNDLIAIVGTAAYFSAAFLITRQLTMLLTRKTFSQLFVQFYHFFPVSWLIVFLLFIELIVAVNIWGTYPLSQELSTAPTPPATIMSNTAALGNLIYTDYIYAFQLSGMILLVAMIGAITLTLRKREGVKLQSVKQQINRSKHEAVELVKVVTNKGINL